MNTIPNIELARRQFCLFDTEEQALRSYPAAEYGTWQPGPGHTVLREAWIGLDYPEDAFTTGRLVGQLCNRASFIGEEYTYPGAILTVDGKAILPGFRHTKKHKDKTPEADRSAKLCVILSACKVGDEIYLIDECNRGLFKATYVKCGNGWWERDSSYVSR
jgi:hypothetical protein